MSDTEKSNVKLIRIRHVEVFEDATESIEDRVNTWLHEHRGLPNDRIFDIKISSYCDNKGQSRSVVMVHYLKNVISTK